MRTSVIIYIERCIFTIQLMLRYKTGTASWQISIREGFGCDGCIGCDKRKFVILYETYRCLMMKVALNILHDSFLAEDAVQYAFIHIARNMDKIGSVKSLETKNYLVIAVKNASIDIYRKRSVRMKREIFVDELGEAGESVYYMETDTDNSVLEVLKNLPVMYRDVFLLKYSGRLENKEIARMLRISEANVRKRIERGKAVVQDMLDGLEGKGNGAYKCNG